MPLSHEDHTEVFLREKAGGHSVLGERLWELKVYQEQPYFLQLYHSQLCWFTCTQNSLTWRVKY